MAQRPLRLRVTCPCGESTSVPAGGAVACACGRSWDTSSVPTADVTSVQDAVQSSVRRLRRRQAGFVLTLLLAVGVLLVLRTSTPTLVLVPVFGLLWLRLCLPWWKARRQPRLAGVPTWNLAPTHPLEKERP